MRVVSRGSIRKNQQRERDRRVEKNCERERGENGREVTARRDKEDEKEKKEARRMELYYGKNMYEKKIKELE